MENAISPLDERYKSKLRHLSVYFSEFALMRIRCLVELQYIEGLNTTGLFPKLSDPELERIHVVKHNFSTSDYDKIKIIEKEVNHDIKACEIFLREKLQLNNSNLIHFGLTSEDVNNLSYTLLLKEFIEQEQIPLIIEILFTLCELSNDWKKIPFPTRTHGQKASPSTAGKEIAVFISRILRQFKRLKQLRFMGKLNGATGNFAAMLAAFPDYDWLYFSCNFIERLGLLPNIATTQIEDHDTWAEYFSIVKQINNIILDMDRDIWMYLMLGYMIIIPKKSEVGSSTMPHKVNPINFENSEGNLEISNALLETMITKLTHSRMQRDLSDSTIARNIGVALGHSYLAFKKTLKGLKNLQINKEKCLEELDNSQELLAEPIQTMLKVEGLEDPYSLVKEIMRGREVKREEVLSFINQLDIKEEVKEKLRSLNVRNYIGYAIDIRNLVLEEVRSELQKGDL